VARHSDWSGWGLGLALSLIPFAIDVVNFTEGTVFLKRAGLDWRTLSQSALAYALLIPVWAMVFGKHWPRPKPSGRPLRGRSVVWNLWRVIVSDFAYLLVYFTAGMIIFPLVRAFYAQQQLPSLGTIALVQLLLRGPAFTAICLLLMRMVGVHSGWKGRAAT